jgi:hypothetical protein
MKSLRMKTTSLLIGCLCASASLASTAFGDTTLYIQSTSAGIGSLGVNFAFPTPADLLNNYDHIQAVFNAPSGYAFSTSGGVFVAAIMYHGPYDTTYTHTDDLFESSTINFVPGMASPTTYSSGEVDENDNAFARGYPEYPAGHERRNILVTQQFQFDGPVEFTSLTMQLKVDPNPDYPNLSLAPFGSGGFVGVGSQISFVPIPEPSIAALALLGASATAWRLRSRMHTRMKITP